MEKPIKSVASTYGIYLGIILSLFTVIAYAVDLSLFTKWWFGILSIVILIVVSIVAVKAAKKQVSELFTFKMEIKIQKPTSNVSRKSN